MKDEPAFNARLVGTIEQYPCLYNYKMKEYSNRNTTDQAWTKVAQEMKETGNYTYLFINNYGITTFHWELIETADNKK